MPRLTDAFDALLRGSSLVPLHAKCNDIRTVCVVCQSHSIMHTKTLKVTLHDPCSTAAGKRRQHTQCSYCQAGMSKIYVPCLVWYHVKLQMQVQRTAQAKHATRHNPSQGSCSSTFQPQHTLPCVSMTVQWSHTVRTPLAVTLHAPVCMQQLPLCCFCFLNVFHFVLDGQSHLYNAGSPGSRVQCLC